MKQKLPASGTVIIDEAHHFERAASEHLGRRASYIGLHTKLSRIGTLKEHGLLKRMTKLFYTYDLPAESFLTPMSG